ncbi:hypothetical protein [Streptomyces chryseus]|uniref:hypothetical protein n=1 Tax=Streptomyces chryseus TaxID=68186 RepID=UPI00110FAB8B|nr:hypothetical protein [Streptomyces chryseus]
MITVDGRPVLSRADIHEQYGYATSMLERWWKDREDNGHPPVAHRIGNTLYWDAEEWKAWDHQRLNPETAGLANRDQLAARVGLTRAQFNRLWADRDANGHPQPVRTVGRAHTLYWDADQWAQWFERHRENQRAKAEPPPTIAAADDTGPDDEIGPADFARILGLKHPKWVSQSALTPPPGFPEPDAWDELPSGRRRPRWRRRRAQAYADTRHTITPTRTGRPVGSGQRAHPYQGDPRLTLARQVLADRPDAKTSELVEEALKQAGDKTTSARTWTLILKTAREHPEPTP